MNWEILGFFYNLLKFVCFGYFRSDIVYDAYQLFLWVFYIAGFFLLGILLVFFLQLQNASKR